MPVFTRYLSGILDELEERTSIMWSTGRKPTDRPDFPAIPYLAVGEWRPGDTFKDKLTCSGHASGEIVPKEVFIQKCARLCPPAVEQKIYQEASVVEKKDGTTVDHVIHGQLKLPF
jgi:hypothetical protein